MSRQPVRILLLPMVVILGLLLIQCGDDKVTNSNATSIDENLAALSHLDQVDPFTQRPVGDAELDTYEVDGRTYECSVQEYEVAAEFNEQLSLNPTSDILWPGALIDGATIETGEYIPIITPRAPVTISISLENLDKVSATVENPKLSTMREAISDILAQEVTGATAANVNTYIEDVYSESQLSIALGVTYNDGLTSVKGNFDFNNHEILSRIVVKFIQVYYTIDIDIPTNKASDLFPSEVSWQDLRTQISGDIRPMYISSISYGRMAFFTVESTYSSTQVRAALSASMTAINTDVDLKTEYKEVFANSTMKATIIGGSGADAVGVIDGFEGLKTYIRQGGNYNKDTAAAPLAYKLRYLGDNGACRVVMANNYMIRSCDELRPGYYGILNSGWYVCWFHVYYDLDGQPVDVLTKSFTAGFSKSVQVPAKATNVYVLAREDTGLGYKNIFRYPNAPDVLARPDVKCWKVTGTTLNPGHSEIQCDF